MNGREQETALLSPTPSEGARAAERLGIDQQICRKLTVRLELDRHVEEAEELPRAVELALVEGLLGGEDQACREQRRHARERAHFGLGRDPLRDRELQWLGGFDVDTDAGIVRLPSDRG